MFFWTKNSGLLSPKHTISFLIRTETIIQHLGRTTRTPCAKLINQSLPGKISQVSQVSRYDQMMGSGFEDSTFIMWLKNTSNESLLKIIPMFYYIVLSKPLDITNKNKERTLHFLMNYHIVLSFVILRLKKQNRWQLTTGFWIHCTRAQAVKAKKPFFSVKTCPTVYIS